MIDSGDAQAFLAAIVDSSDDAIIGKDLDGIIQSCNAAGERLFGYAASELIGRPVAMLIPPDRQHEEMEILSRLRRGERIGHFETVRIRKDGQPVEISLSVSPIRDARGTIIGAAKIARDVTERNQAQRALAEQREWLRATLESIGDAVIATDARGRIAFMNPVAEVLTGVSSADAHDRPCADVFRIFNEFTRQETPSPVDRVLREGVVVGLANHTVLIAADGTERPIDDSGAPIRDSEDCVAGVVLVFRDITERRKNENERRATAAEREQLLDSERAARAEAERANRVKDDFVATVSHELRTPLNAILGWTEMLRVAPGDLNMVERAVDVIARNTRVQAQLVSDLLDLSRIVSGKLRIDMQDVDLPRVIENAIQTVEPSAIAKSVTITVNIDPALGVIRGDPDRLQQIVWNLLSNAVKFTPAGGSIHVLVKPLDGFVDIVVADTGAGMAPALIPTVFDRFKQGDSSTSRKFGGLGIGLSIVKHLVELHRGRVRAESDGEGQGSTFTVTLPRIDGPAMRRTHAEGPAVVSALDDATSLANIRILIVEDDADTLNMIRTLLESRGAVVSAASNAAEALTRHTQEPDLLLCDIGLPEIDGYQLIRRIRSGAAPMNRIPAIALTAFARPEDRTRALQAGFQAHLSKPVEPAELVTTIASFAGLIDQERPRT